MKKLDFILITFVVLVSVLIFVILQGGIDTVYISLIILAFGSVTGMVRRTILKFSER
ncbi:hypothetical protein [Bacillus sp. Hm123]|uniref:hypothetical protein n=1 Tax=Bacillus sp. Hm123 TaxID=3450745 RepID=UPI003F4238D1